MRWMAWLLVAFALHFTWEMYQAKWFASMTGLPFWTATFLCLRATLGDLVITIVAFAAAAGTARVLMWPLRLRVVPMLVFLATGMAITIGYEIFALRSGRWTYAEDMPTVFGIGLLPILQWSLIPPIEVALFRLLWRDRGSAGAHLGHVC